MRAATFTASLALALCACGSTASTEAEERNAPTKDAIDGYGDLKFGMSFAEATAVAGPHLFGPAQMKECLITLAVRGCSLLPENNLASHTSVDGISYGLSLSFNRFDKLTDISLIYQRRMMVDPEQKISAEDCKSIHERTVDWMVRDYGPFSAKSEKGAVIAKTAKGNPYLLTHNDDIMLGAIRKDLSDKRYIALVTYFMGDDDDTNCSLSLQFAEPRAVERRKLSPELQEKFDSIVKD